MSFYDIGIDLGTTKIIIYRSDKGILLKEPSVVAYRAKDDKIVALGQEAYKMIGKEPRGLVVERPLQKGVISNHKLTEILVREYIKKVCGNFFVKPRVVICIPSSTTDVERRAVINAALSGGARKIYLIEEPIAAAIGAGLDVLTANGNILVDIGGGTTDIAVISLNGIVCSKSITTAGNVMDEQIQKHFLLNNKLSIGQRTAEAVKRQVGCVFDPSTEIQTEVKGMNLLTKYPQKITIDETTLYSVMLSNCEKIIDGIRDTLERTPPELASDIYNNGIYLTGGGSQIKGLPKLIEKYIKIPVHVVENPVDAVGRGTGLSFKYIGILRDGFTSADTYKH